MTPWRTVSAQQFPDICNISIEKVIMVDRPNPGPQVVKFEAPSERAALAKAQEWINDFTKHPSIYVQRLTVAKESNKFVAIVIYSLPD
jgi:hypothetical protein